MCGRALCLHKAFSSITTGLVLARVGTIDIGAHTLFIGQREREREGGREREREKEGEGEM